VIPPASIYITVVASSRVLRDGRDNSPAALINLPPCATAAPVRLTVRYVAHFSFLDRQVNQTACCRVYA
jgi:hypothetical protein